MKKRNLRLYIIVSLIVIVTILQLPFFAPVRDAIRYTISVPARASSAAYSSVVDYFKTITTIDSLVKENSQLQEQVLLANSEIAQLQTVLQENIRLRADLKFSQQRKDLTLTPATIINFAPSGAYRAITISVGSENGVKEGQAVVAQGFLIGKVKNVSAKTAEVWLLTNRSIVTPVRLTTSQTTGILKGGVSGLVVDNIPIDTKVAKGELVVTSSLEGLYPEGIAIGKVEEILSRKEEIFLTLRISTPVNINSITHVYIVQ